MPGAVTGGWGKEDLMSLTFLSKKLAKSSGRREEGGMGGGGWRSEEKVSNSFLGLEAEEVIFKWKNLVLAAVREEEKMERRD